jgi:hypothetical protein
MLITNQREGKTLMSEQFVYRFKGVPVPNAYVPFAVYLEVAEQRLCKVVRERTGSDRGEGPIGGAIAVVAFVLIAGAIVFALNALKDKTVKKVNSTNP